MFEKNDKALLTAKTIVMVIIALFAIVSLIAGILLAVLIHVACIVLTFVLWFLCWLMWVFRRLHLSYLCDIKLIRNKLYDESNDGLEAFLKTVVGDKYNEEYAEIEEEKLALEEMKNNKIITLEEYERKKKALIEKENSIQN